MKHLLALAVLAASAFSVSAQTVSTAGSFQNGIGNDFGVYDGHLYDEFTFNANTFNVGFGPVDITSYNFLAGISSNQPAGTTVNGDLSLTLTLDGFGVSDTLVLPYTLTLGNTSDSLSVAATTHDYNIFGTSYRLTTNAFTVADAGVGTAGEFTGTLGLTPAVPEPASVGMMAAGLFGIGIIARRKRRA